MLREIQTVTSRLRTQFAGSNSYDDSRYTTTGSSLDKCGLDENNIVNVFIDILLVGCLFGFYGISTIVDYLTQILFYANSSISNNSV